MCDERRHSTVWLSPYPSCPTPRRHHLAAGSLANRKAHPCMLWRIDCSQSTSCFRGVGGFRIAGLLLLSSYPLVSLVYTGRCEGAIRISRIVEGEHCPSHHRSHRICCKALVVPAQSSWIRDGSDRHVFGIRVSRQTTITRPLDRLVRTQIFDPLAQSRPPG